MAVIAGLLPKGATLGDPAAAVALSILMTRAPTLAPLGVFIGVEIAAVASLAPLGATDALKF